MQIKWMESYEGYDTSGLNKMTKQNVSSWGKKSRGKELISGIEVNQNDTLVTGIQATVSSVEMSRQSEADLKVRCSKSVPNWHTSVSKQLITMFGPVLHWLKFTSLSMLFPTQEFAHYIVLQLESCHVYLLQFHVMDPEFNTAMVNNLGTTQT
jgi:hypothetical protein